MEKRKVAPTNFEEYLEIFPEATQQKLRLMRSTIIKAAPKAAEIISYQMPAFKYYGRLVYFAALKIISGFIQWHQASKHLPKKYPLTSTQKDQFNSLWMKNCRLA